MINEIVCVWKITFSTDYVNQITRTLFVARSSVNYDKKCENYTRCMLCDSVKESELIVTTNV